ncbi:MAG: hypothetical protein RL701_1702 [Pseudomonadota bacterium]|jgi:RNA polymerase sigma-70 factor (ECF subfamily)
MRLAEERDLGAGTRHLQRWVAPPALQILSKRDGTLRVVAKADITLRSVATRDNALRVVSECESMPAHTHEARDHRPRTVVTMRAAFERAVAPCCDSLRRTALRLTKRRADADDLVQETLLRAWRFWPRYRDEDNCRGWLQRILSNVFYSEHRARKRKQAQLLDYATQAHVAAGAGQVANPELAVPGNGNDPHRLVSHEQLARSLAALTPGQRHILHLVDVDERSYREAAAELACPLGTVMSRLHRARLALRTQLAKSSCA